MAYDNEWHMEVHDTSVHERRLARLVRRTPCLERITLSSPLPIKFLNALFSELMSGSRSLQSLTIHRCNFNPRLNLFKKLRNSTFSLQRLDLSRCVFPLDMRPLSRALGHNRTIQHLDLSGCKLGGECGGTKQLFATLVSMPALKHLDLSCNSLGFDASKLGAAHIAFGLLVGSASLQHLNLSRNSLQKQHMDNVFRALLAPGVALQHLDISYNDSCGGYPVQGYADCSVLGEALGVNTSLTHLDLSNCGQLEAEPLFSALSVNSTLTYLDLSDTSLDKRKQCCAALARALRVNASLLHLDLYSCKLGCYYGSSTAFVSVAEALQYNSALQHLNLHGNNLGNAEIKALAQSLTFNPTLRHLDLEDNPMSSAGCRALASAISANTSLEHLGIDARFPKRRALAALAAALDCHPSVKELGIHYWKGAAFDDLDDIDSAILTNSSSILTKILHGDVEAGGESDTEANESDEETYSGDNSTDLDNGE